MAQTKRKAHDKSAATVAVAASPRKTQPQKWQLQTAKAKFSEVFRRARTEGPQHVVKHGTEEVVVISKEDFEKLHNEKPREGGIWEFFRNSPLVGLDLDLEREDDYGREIDL
jgi:prevent-host-death family protein